MGGQIGSALVTVAGGADEIVSFLWSPPNPAHYATFGADQHHFCLLARIETSGTPPFGMTSPETSNLYANVANNNNIVWKNISVVDDVPGSGRTAGLTVANFDDTRQDLRLLFTVPDEHPTVFDWGRVFVDLPLRLAERLQDRPHEGVEWLTETAFAVVEPNATLGGDVELEPGEVHAVHVRFAAAGDPTLGVRVLMLDVQQLDGRELVGGVRFAVRTHAAPRPGHECEGAGPLDGHSWIGPAYTRGHCRCG